MTQHSFRNIVLVAVSVCLLLLTVQTTPTGAGEGRAPAVAGPTAKKCEPEPSTICVVTARSNLPPKYFGIALSSAECPAGYGLISGGAAIQDASGGGSSTQNHFPHLAHSWPDLANHTWMGAAVQPPPPGGPPLAGELVVFAVCSKSGQAVVVAPVNRAGAPTPVLRSDATLIPAGNPLRPTLVTARKTVNIPGKFFAVAVADATCPAGYAPIAGGGKITSTWPRLVQSFPEGTRVWRTIAVQPPFVSGAVKPGGGTLTTYAICSKDKIVPLPNRGGVPVYNRGLLESPAGGGGPGIRAVTDSAPIPGKLTAGASVTARCPEGYGLISGGAHIRHSVYPHLMQNYPVVSNAAWFAYAAQPVLLSGVYRPDPGVLTAFALCVRGSR